VCRTYTEALDAIESLEESARAVGLTVSDYKTYTPTLLTYFLKNTGLDISDTTLAVDPSDVEAIVLEYIDSVEGETVESAIATLKRTRAENLSGKPIDLRQPSREEVRDVRRAVSALAHHRDGAGLDYMMSLLVFVPSLTPRVCDYLLAIDSEESRHQVVALVDQVLARVSLGEWQALWFTHVCRQLNLLGEATSRIEWVRKQRDRARGRPLGAEAALTLAAVGAADFDDLDRALRTEPEALAPWFLLAMKSMALHVPDRHATRARAVRDSGPLQRILLDI
jgi:hypothetical protein